MALRKPLVQVAGKLQQLQAGDTLDAVVSGGEQINLTNDEVAAVVICSPVYTDTNDGFKKAQANAASTSDAIGLVAQSPSIANGVAGPVQLGGLFSATTAQWDAVTGDVGGLVFKTRYYLDPATAGKLTKTAPSTVGQTVIEIGIGISTTELDINIKSTILL